MSDNSSVDLVPNVCADPLTALYVGMAINLTKAALLIPLYVYVLSLGFQQWRQQRSFKTTSHSDIFTYHVAAVELLWIIALGFYVLGVYTPVSEVLAHYFISISWYGESLFHVLTCMERYLAVIHPIVYMRLRNPRGVRIRNISIACVWILSCVGAGFLHLSFNHPKMLFPILVPFVVFLVAVSFCSLSVLRVLMRPRPGDGGQGRDVVDKAKQRAFFAMMAIMAVLWLWFGGLLTFLVAYMASLVGYRVKCVVVSCVYMFNLPSALVLPVLYLHRAGKLSLCFRRCSPDESTPKTINIDMVLE